MSYDPPLIAPLSDYLQVPSHAPDPERAAAFAESLESLRGKGASKSAAAYNLPYPKHEFLAYAAERGGVLLHGSNDPAIDVMSPRRRTLDARHTHSQAAVFACADGIWPLYFALIDRSLYRGTLRNDARLIRSPSGEPIRAYHLSVNETVKWRNGTVYFLAMDGFSRLGDESSLEWTRPTKVTPFARLAVTPADFPLVSQVRTHDDSSLERVRGLSIKLVSTCDSYDELADGYAMHYGYDWASEVEELITLLKVVNSWLEGDITHHSSGGMTVSLRGAPALKDMLAQGLRSPRIASPLDQADPG